MPSVTYRYTRLGFPMPFSNHISDEELSHLYAAGKEAEANAMAGYQQPPQKHRHHWTRKDAYPHLGVFCMFCGVQNQNVHLWLTLEQRSMCGVDRDRRNQTKYSKWTTTDPVAVTCKQCLVLMEVP